MRHKNKRYQLSRFTSWHDATVKSIAKSLVTYESIKTTLHRAKAVRPMAEELISLARANTLSAKRDAFSILGDHKLVSVLFNEIGPRFANRSSGYTRIINLGKRRGDDAKVVIFELTEKKPKLKRVKKAKDAHKVDTTEKHEHEHIQQEPASEEKKTETQSAVKEKPPVTKKPNKKFLGGIRNIFKKERDSL